MLILIFALIVLLQIGSLWTTVEFRRRGIAEEAIPWNRFLMQLFGYAPVIALKAVLVALVGWLTFGFPFSGMTFVVLTASFLVSAWDTGGNIALLLGE